MTIPRTPEELSLGPTDANALGRSDDGPRSFEPDAIYKIEEIAGVLRTDDPKRFLQHHSVKPLGGITETRYYGGDIINGINAAKRKYESDRYAEKGAQKTTPRNSPQDRQDRSSKSGSKKWEEGDNLDALLRQDDW